MSEHIHDAANITNPEHAEHHIVSPLEYSFVFITLLIGAAITVVAAELEIGIFKPLLRLQPAGPGYEKKGFGLGPSA